MVKKEPGEENIVDLDDMGVNNMDPDLHNFFFRFVTPEKKLSNQLCSLKILKKIKSMS